MSYLHSFFLITFIAFYSCTEESSETIKQKVSSENLLQNTNQNEKKEYHYPNGLLWSTSEYKDGKRHGLTTSYYQNGQLRYTGFYKNDKKSGLWFFYNEDGSFEKEVNFDSIQ